MRILNLDQLSKEPAGTVFSTYDGSDFNYGIFSMKTATGYANLTPNFLRTAYKYNGTPSETERYLTGNFSTDASECTFKADQLYAVYSKDEIKRMMSMLMYALCDGNCKLDSDDTSSICS